MTAHRIDLSDAFRPREGVLVRELDGEAVLLDLASGRYFGLNSTGRRIWELLAATPSLAGVLVGLSEEFDGPREALEADLLRIVAELEAEDLVFRLSMRAR